MNIRNLVVMTLVLAALATLYHFREKVAAPADEDLKRPQLTKFKMEDVTGLDATINDKAIKMEKQDGVWTVTAPYRGLASKKDLDAVLTALADLKADRVVAEDGGTTANLKQYGLDKPKVTFVVHLKDSKETPTVLVGARAPSEAGWYTMQPGNPRVVLSGNSLTFSFVKQPADWREKSPLSFEPDQVDRIAVDAGTYQLQLEKAKGTEQWSMTKPKASKAETTEVTKLFNSVRGQMATKFLDDVKPDDPRLRPTLTLKVWGKDARDPQELKVGQLTPEGYLCLRGTKVPEVFILSAKAVKSFQPEPSTLSDHHLFDFTVDQPSRAEMFQEEAGAATAGRKSAAPAASASPAAPAAPAATDQTWTFTKPSEQKDDMGRVTALLYSLRELKYEARVTEEAKIKEATASFAKPFARFELFDDKGTRLAGLEVGGQAGRQRRWVRVIGGTDIYIADTSFANDWKATIKSLSGGPQSSASSPAPAGSQPPSPAPAPAGSQPAASSPTSPAPPVPEGPQPPSLTAPTSAPAVPAAAQSSSPSVASPAPASPGSGAK